MLHDNASKEEHDVRRCRHHRHRPVGRGRAFARTFSSQTVAPRRFSKSCRTSTLSAPPCPPLTSEPLRPAGVPPASRPAGAPPSPRHASIFAPSWPRAGLDPASRPAQIQAAASPTSPPSRLEQHSGAPPHLRTHTPAPRLSPYHVGLTPPPSAPAISPWSPRASTRRLAPHHTTAATESGAAISDQERPGSGQSPRWRRSRSTPTPP